MATLNEIEEFLAIDDDLCHVSITRHVASAPACPDIRVFLSRELQDVMSFRWLSQLVLSGSIREDVRLVPMFLNRLFSPDVALAPAGQAAVVSA